MSYALLFSLKTSFANSRERSLDSMHRRLPLIYMTLLARGLEEPSPYPQTLTLNKSPLPICVWIAALQRSSQPFSTLHVRTMIHRQIPFPCIPPVSLCIAPGSAKVRSRIWVGSHEVICLSVGREATAFAQSEVPPADDFRSILLPSPCRQGNGSESMAI